MPIKFADEAWEDYLHWEQTDKCMLKRITTLRKHMQRQPFEGLRKPEPLKHGLTGLWSQRIDEE
jgi:toxin YoeB